MDAKTAIAGVQYLVLLQACSRIATFVLNVLVVRHVSASVIGVANLQLVFLYQTSLFLVREACRRTCARRVSLTAGDAIARRNITAVCTLAGVAVVAGLNRVFRMLSTSEELSVDGYLTACDITSVAVLIELLAEPFYNYLQAGMEYGRRVAVEAGALLLRCVVLYALVRGLGMGLLAFPAAQLVHSVALLGFHAASFMCLPIARTDPPLSPWEFILPPLGHSLSVDREDRLLLFQFTWQSVEKVILAQGETIVLKYFQVLAEQASFAVVTNLGSLVIRFLFQPIEEVSFNLFSRLCHDGRRDPARPGSSARELRTAAGMLSICIKIMLWVGLVFICFGTRYSFLLMDLLYGGKFRDSDGPDVLAAYCLFVAAAGLNGVTESFVHAASDRSSMADHNRMLLVFSAINVATSVALVGPLGTGGIILSNSLVMTIRIAHSAHYIGRYMSTTRTPLPLSDCLPTLPVLASFGLSHAGIAVFQTVVPTSTFFSYAAVAQIAVGGLAFLATIGVTLISEKEFVGQCRKLVSRKVD